MCYNVIKLAFSGQGKGRGLTKNRIAMVKNKKGFTLIEVLIVVAIIAILSSVVLVGLGPTQRAGRDARRVSDLRQTQNGLELYYNRCGYYPGTTVMSSGSCTGYTSRNTWSGMIDALTGSSLGISTMPQDPTAGHTYYYASNGSSYVIAAVLEDVNNAAFSNYTGPSVTGFSFGDLPPSGVTLDCDAPVYCVTL